MNHAKGRVCFLLLCGFLMFSLESVLGWVVGSYLCALVPANVYILLKYPDLEKEVTSRSMPEPACVVRAPQTFEKDAGRASSGGFWIGMGLCLRAALVVWKRRALPEPEHPLSASLISSRGSLCVFLPRLRVRFQTIDYKQNGMQAAFNYKMGKGAGVV